MAARRPATGPCSRQGHRCRSDCLAARAASRRAASSSARQVQGYAFPSATSRFTCSRYSASRSSCRYGPTGPPTSGPSSQSSASQRRPSRIARTASSVERSTSVSSMRRMNVPPCARAKSQLYRAVRTPPTCRYPVGLGAKRTRTPPAGGAVMDVSGSVNVRDLTRGVRDAASQASGVLCPNAAARSSRSRASHQRSAVSCQQSRSRRGRRHVARCRTLPIGPRFRLCFAGPSAHRMSAIDPGPVVRASGPQTLRRDVDPGGAREASR